MGIGQINGQALSQNINPLPSSSGGLEFDGLFSKSLAGMIKPVTY